MPERVAIVRLSAIGDVVHGLPLAGSLRRTHPAAEITWITQAGPAPLLEDHPWVDRVMIYPRRSGAAAAARFVAALPRERFDLAIDAQGNMKSGLVLAGTGAPRRVGLARAEYRERLGAFAASEHAAPADGPHSVDRTLALARHLGDPDPKPDFGLAPTEAERHRAEDDLAGLERPLVAISVGATDDVREWPDEHYVATIRRLVERGVTPLLLSGPAHRSRCEELARATGAAARAGTTDLRGLLAHLSVLASTGPAVLLACDSAPLHIATAVGLPVVALSGPQDPARTGPYGHGDSAITAWDGLDCAPCRKRKCRLGEEPLACMAHIEPAMVADRILARIGGA
ncbi:MAG: glycosyltransferase family 9 protein [Planctomycetota bacterium]